MSESSTKTKPSANANGTAANTQPESPQASVSLKQLSDGLASLQQQHGALVVARDRLATQLEEVESKIIGAAASIEITQQFVRMAEAESVQA